MSGVRVDDPPPAYSDVFPVGVDVTHLAPPPSKPPVCRAVRPLIPSHSLCKQTTRDTHKHSLTLQKVVPVIGQITSLQIEKDHYTGCMFVYVQTNRKPTLDKYNFHGYVKATFGTGSGGFILDPDQSRDRVLVASGALLTLHHRDGTLLNSWDRKVAIGCKHSIVSMTVVAKGTNVKYVAIDAHGNTLIISPNNGGIIKHIRASMSDAFVPRHLATNPALCHYIALSDNHSNQVRMYNIKGRLTDIIGCYGYGDDDLKTPKGMCIDHQGRLLVCDHGNGRVMQFTRSHPGVWRGECVVTPEMMWYRLPCHVAVSADGHVVVSVQSHDSTESGWMMFSGYNKQV